MAPYLDNPDALRLHLGLPDVPIYITEVNLIPIEAIIHEFDHPLSAELAERFTTKLGGMPTNWGEAALNRINKQSYLYRNRYPSGSNITGAIN